MAAPGKEFPWEERLLRSGYFVGAVLLHLVVFALLAGYVIFRAPTPEQPVQFTPQFNPRAPDLAQPHPPDTAAAGAASVAIDPGAGISPDTPVAIRGGGLPIRVSVPPGSALAGNSHILPRVRPAREITTKGISSVRLRQIQVFVASHRTRDAILRHDPAGDYPVFVAAYADGDWACNLTLDSAGHIVAGSVPNLVAKISEWTHRQVNAHVDPRPLAIGGPELMAQKPPFIFLTGHKDFVLTPQEVENLREYVVMGGVIWGDNAEAGYGSRFDVAFRREMHRIIPSDTFQPYGPDAEIFRGRYEFDRTPQGMNFQAEPIEHIDLDGKLAILYTPDDYSDLYTMRILPGDAQIQGTRPTPDSPLITPGLFLDHNGLFFRNYTLTSSLAVQHLGLNIVTYLLTRFDDDLQLVP
jgi:hypothetical protein